MTSRVNNTIKNILWGNVSQVVSLLVKFVSRTVFIYYLGQAYMGVSGLFANVLGVLAFSELGIGTAMNYALYKPVAEDDKEKIKSLMALYKKAYRVIALIVALAGMALLPFLRYLVKDPGNIGNIHVYYLIFLFDTATSYLVSYKYSLVSAEQKSYVMTNVNMVVTILVSVVQIVGMFLYQSFMLYLMIQAVMGIGVKVFNAWYLDRRYPFLKGDAQPLEKCEVAGIKKNVFALIVHKIGDVCVHQTDNILISAFISLQVTGMISNYNYIIVTVTGFLSIIFSSVIGSLGNLIASENTEKQYAIFKTYRVVGFWLYGFCALAYFTLFQPFIAIWAGPNWVVDELSVFLICLERYNIGHRMVVNNFKSAAGIFEQDKWVAFGQAAVNLGVSIAMVKKIGLPGIYVGTVVQGLLATVVKPTILYKYAFHKPVWLYFGDSLKYLAVELALGAILFVIRKIIVPDLATVSLASVLALFGLAAVIPNVAFIILFHNTREFKYLWGIFHDKFFVKAGLC